MSKMPELVLVEWIDSVGTAGVDVWTDVSEVKDFNICKCLSIGWLFKETDEYIVIVPHIGQEKDDSMEDNQVSGAMLIPQCSISVMRTISVGKGKRASKAKKKR